MDFLKFLNKKPLFTVLFVLWLCAVTYLSLATFEGVDTGGINIPHADKIVHCIFYFGVAVSGVLLIKEQFALKVSIKKALWLSFCFAFLYGIGIEFVQYFFTSNRQGDYLDALANTTGALLGILTINYMLLKTQIFKWK